MYYSCSCTLALALLAWFSHQLYLETITLSAQTTPGSEVQKLPGPPTSSGVTSGEAEQLQTKKSWQPATEQEDYFLGILGPRFIFAEETNNSLLALVKQFMLTEEPRSNDRTKAHPAQPEQFYPKQSDYMTVHSLMHDYLP